MKNVIIMCRAEGCSTVINAMNPDEEISQIGLAGDVNAAARAVIESGRIPVVCNMFATKYSAVSLLYKKYFIDGIEETTAGEMKRYFDDCEGAILIGMTAKAGTEKAFCAGTYNHVAWHDYLINGTACGESEIYRTFFESYGIPVLAVSGDEACCEEIKRTIDGAATIAVKRADYRLRAAVYEATEKAICAGVREALTRAGKREFTSKTPLSVEIRYNRTDFCDDSYERNNRTLERPDARTLRKTVEKINTIFDLIF